MGASDTEIDCLSGKLPAVLRCILLGFQQCTSDTDGILISTGFVPTLLPITFHPKWACFDSYLCFDDNTALFTPNGYIFTHHLHQSNH